MSMTEPLQARDDLVVQTRNLTKQFEETVAVNDLSFYVPRGTIFGIIGPSGCGKTTAVRLLTGVYRPTSGEALVLGQHPAHFSQETRGKIGYMLRNSVLYQDLTVWENLNFASATCGVGPVLGKRLRAVLDFVELLEHRGKPLKNISGGMRRRLSLASTLVHNPTLLFLDEPTTGIDPVLPGCAVLHASPLGQRVFQRVLSRPGAAASGGAGRFVVDPGDVRDRHAAECDAARERDKLAVCGDSGSDGRGLVPGGVAALASRYASWRLA